MKTQEPLGTQTPMHVRFSRNAYALMDRQGMTQRELARRCGMSYVNLNRILRGFVDPSMATYWKIASELSSRPFSMFERKPVS